MAAYAALVSLMHLIDDLQNHPSPPISLDKQQVQSLTQNIMFLQKFLEGYISPLADGDEADPLEMRIADAAYAVEDVIESHIVDKIKLTEESKNASSSTGANCNDESTKFHQDLQKMIEEMDLIKGEAMVIHDQGHTFVPINASLRPSSSSSSSSSTGNNNNFVVCPDLKHHHSPPVQSLTENVMFLQEFHEGYVSPVADGDEADPLEMRIADAAYAAEDVIESRIVDKIQLNRPKETKISRFINFFRGPKNPFKLSKDLQKRRKVTEKVVARDQGTTFVPIASLRPSSSSIGKNNSFVVCSDDVVKEIMEELFSHESQRLVIPIVGMGGIGKTTLAKTIYSKPLIKKHFGICAWAAISQQYDTREILCEILSQATGGDKKKITERSEHILGDKLHKHLFHRRFFIVLDDMWSVDAWDKIRNYFPDNNNNSRVLVTTRISQLGFQLNNNYSHRMKFLDEASSWYLFSKTVFGENNCPRELEETGKKIVENCRGLPLSIVVVGGMLRNKEPNKEYWESIRKNLASVVNLENDKNCLRLLKLSYNHLPVNLKPCFLYMGVFEEDDSINVSTLVKLWVCEGFLKPIDGKSLETIAKGFLADLVLRNLILIDGLGYTGNIKRVKIHDLLRDVCLSEVKKEGFYHVVGQGSPQDGISRQRRVVIRKNTPKKQVVDEVKCRPHVRSIIYESGKVPRQCRKLGFLRAFHAYYRDTPTMYMMNSFVLQYVNLQHLAGHVSSMSSIFASLNLPWNLHTLIVSCPEESTAPADIWKMAQLRHIELAHRRFCLPDPPRDVVIMKNLQILKGVKNFKCSEEVAKRIPNLKKLEVQYSESEGMEHDDYYCLSNIRRLSKLESLRMDGWLTFRGNSLHKLIFPHSLKSLSLNMKDDFEWGETLEKIGSLPKLEKLKLWSGLFGTGKWEVVEDQFPSLKHLGLNCCGNLKEWGAKTEDSSIFPLLENIHLFGLKELEEIPFEIGYIPTLQRIDLILCSESAMKCAKRIVDEQVELRGDPIPFLVLVSLQGKNEAIENLASPPYKVSTEINNYSVLYDYVNFLSNN